MEEKTYFSYFAPHSVDTKFIENTKKYKEKVDIFHPNFVWLSVLNILSFVPEILHDEQLCTTDRH